MDISDKAKTVRLAAFDVDGVLTDGALYYTDAGEEFKAFNVQDGHGIKMLQESGVAIAIITSRSSKLVANRARNLGIASQKRGTCAACPYRVCSTCGTTGHSARECPSRTVGIRNSQPDYF